MATSQVPVVIDAVFAAATAALPSVRVFDGYGSTEDYGDYLMVGVDDPDGPAAAQSADAQQAAATMGTNRSRDETFDLNCAAFSWNGDGIQKAARDAAYTIMFAVADLLRDDPSIGITLPYVLVAEMGTHKLNQNVTAGANALIMFTIHVRARI